MKCAHPRERSAKDRSLKDVTGGHPSTPHTSQDKDVEGQDEDEELSRREWMEIVGKERLLVTNPAPLVDRIRACDLEELAPTRNSSKLAASVAT